jgi:hypothetical protein
MRFHRQVAGKEDIRFWESEMRLNMSNVIGLVNGKQ